MRKLYQEIHVFLCMVSGSSWGQFLPKGWGHREIPRGQAKQRLPQPGSILLPSVRELAGWEEGRHSPQLRASGSPMGMGMG